MGLALDRPGFLWLLLVPLGLLLVASLPTRAPDLGVGTLEVWRRVAREVGVRGERRRRRVPLWLALLCGGLAAAVLGLAEPQQARATTPPTIDVVIEPGPALTVAFVGPGGAQGGTRFERGCAQVLDLVGRSEGRARLRWHAGREVIETSQAEPPPLTSRALIEAPAVDWERWDRPGVVWLLSAPPERAPNAASWVATGGAAAPGPIDVRGGRVAVWDSGTVTERPFDGAPPVLELDPHTPEPWRTLAELWARARGLATTQVPGGDEVDVVLSVSVVGAVAEGPPRRCGRDGWSIPVVIAQGGAVSTEDAPWLEWRGEVVAWESPGRLTLVAGPWGEPEGDPAAFALSVGRLLDRLQLPPRGTAPIAARWSRGSPASHRGASAQRGSERDRSLAHWPLLVAAVALTAAAAASGTTRRRVQAASEAASSTSLGPTSP
ncbi:hypothetical protein [Engelhardtia mirabilis]|uniref:Uncharacterized protein n=1 Tax=Engelhardtia mirabilis TaxID=2528011 RepID=A0A518BJY9_9BACT|nr:hypothetical protein Pla133_23670 [Planctomycetes bacterium Pla133]QDV01614.1 hypothetical protein Pla86_23660 [Planctomycetes bacterium Pla86]